MIRLLFILFLTGCSTAGTSHYYYEHEHPDGSIDRIDLKNGKDVGLIHATITLPNGMMVELLEQGVDASGPMGVMAEQNTKLVDRVLDMVPVP